MVKSSPEYSAHTDYATRKSDEQQQLEDVARKYPVRVSKTMRTVMTDKPDDPIARQFLPSRQELIHSYLDDKDPIGDEKHSPVRGIVHRHRDRVLLKALHSCPVYCRFCFRKEMVGPDGHTLKHEELETALAYIKQHSGIREVILTGGDPLMLSARRLSYICDSLREIPHLDLIRIHSRVPIVSPEFMTEDKIAAIKGGPVSSTSPGEAHSVTEKPVYVVLHINHAQEFTAHGERVCKEMVGAGFVLLNESVLLKGINDSVEALDDLMRRCLKNRIKPYYLHHLDHAPGTEHFRVSIEKGQKLMRQLLNTSSGLCQPSYVLDIPGGVAKVPLEACKIEKLGNGRYKIEDPAGAVHDYVDTAALA